MNLIYFENLSLRFTIFLYQKTIFIFNPNAEDWGTSVQAAGLNFTKANSILFFRLTFTIHLATPKINLKNPPI